MKKQNDLWLIQRYLKGDEQSLGILIKSYLGPIYSFVSRYINNSGQDSEDITQDVFVKVWKHIKRFDQSKSFKTWIFEIAKNTAIDFMKKKKMVLFSNFEDEQGENFIEQNIPDFAPIASEILERKESGEIVKEAIMSLPNQYRTTIFLRYNDHFTFKEIAESLGESINTIKSRHRRALAMLKIRLKDSLE